MTFVYSRGGRDLLFTTIPVEHFVYIQTTPAGFLLWKQERKSRSVDKCGCICQENPRRQKRRETADQKTFLAPIMSYDPNNEFSNALDLTTATCFTDCQTVRYANCPSACVLSGGGMNCPLTTKCDIPVLQCTRECVSQTPTRVYLSSPPLY